MLLALAVTAAAAVGDERLIGWKGETYNSKEGRPVLVDEGYGGSALSSSMRRPPESKEEAMAIRMREMASDLANAADAIAIYEAGRQARARAAE